MKSRTFGPIAAGFVLLSVITPANMAVAQPAILGGKAAFGDWQADRPGTVRLRDGVPTGEYQDFVTGFVVSDSEVWGRPVGVTVARDGALLVSEDGNGTIWRVTH